MSDTEPEITTTSAPVTGSSGQPWLRLSGRMIIVDLIQIVVSAIPLLFALLVLRIEDNLTALIILAAGGVLGAVSDAVRWVFTRYRITDTYVELRTGIVTRSYRSVKRDRIRSVDVEAKLRHRLAGLRVIKIGAGQQSAANESAFMIDAVRKNDAEAVRQLLLKRHEAPAAQQTVASAETTNDRQVFTVLRPWWVVYNMFSIWAFVMAAGLLWGAHWFLGTFGVNVVQGIEGFIGDYESLPVGWLVAGSIVVVGIFGAIGLGINFFIEYWRFELSRVQGEKGTLLRTRQGLFTTREVNRDENRTRGLTISEPLLWRWMHMADTNLITTGLSIWSMSQPTAILPRGPRGIAWSVARRVLRLETNIFSTPMKAHPSAALRRRLTWATVATAAVVILFWLARHDVVSLGAVWIGVALWPVALGAAVVAYKSLGHAIVGKYLVVRSGLLSRSTSALQRTAVSTIAIRQSPLQWRLGLKTVSAMTSAGWGAYVAIDLDADEAIAFASEAAPSLLEPFLIREK